MFIGLSLGIYVFFGVDVILRVIKFVNFCIFYNCMCMDVEGFSFNVFLFGFFGQSLILSFDFDFSIFGLIVELFIGEKCFFCFMGGVMVNFNNYINVNGEFVEGVVVNDYELMFDCIGIINVNYIIGFVVYFYFGFGFGCLFGVRYLSFVLEAGVMVRGCLDIWFNLIGLLSDNV